MAGSLSGATSSDFVAGGAGGSGVSTLTIRIAAEMEQLKKGLKQATQLVQDFTKQDVFGMKTSTTKQSQAFVKDFQSGWQDVSSTIIRENTHMGKDFQKYYIDRESEIQSQREKQQRFTNEFRNGFSTMADNIMNYGTKSHKEFNKYYKDVENTIKANNRFKMSLLGIMFFGMAIQRFFRQFTQRTMEMVGVTDMFSDAVSLMVFKAWEPWLDNAYEVIGWMYDTPEAFQKVVGGFVTLGDVAGTALSNLGQWGLGLRSLREELPILKKNVTDLLFKLKEYAARAWKGTISLVKGAWDMTTVALANLMKWYGKGGTKSMILKIGITLVILEAARRILEWISAESKKSSHEIDVSLNTQGIKSPWDAITKSDSWTDAGINLVGGGLSTGMKGATGIFDYVNAIYKNLTGLADGGIVRKPTLALVGEAGPEAVVPLSRSGGMGMGTNITIAPVVNISGTSSDMDAHSLANQISNIWSDDMRRMMLG